MKCEFANKTTKNYVPKNARNNKRVIISHYLISYL